MKYTLRCMDIALSTLLPGWEDWKIGRDSARNMVADHVFTHPEKWADSVALAAVEVVRTAKREIRETGSITYGDTNVLPLKIEGFVRMKAKDWISVMDRLPPLTVTGTDCTSSEGVLLYANGKVSVGFLIKSKRYPAALWIGHESSHNSVTHWQPIVPPKGV